MKNLILDTDGVFTNGKFDEHFEVCKEINRIMESIINHHIISNSVKQYRRTDFSNQI